MDAQLCPALKGAQDDVVEATCPVVGPVSATLPPNHPKMTEEDAGKVCPVTNATLEHHKDNVHVHPSVPEGRYGYSSLCEPAFGIIADPLPALSSNVLLRRTC